ncbi:Asp23/Gls24 family envelope stress response protein [Streptomyces sp. NPDC047813]|uniref:Asp23/Gls24 family envelope stress response protein n=1 Tax=Streptomyces sp. NPDC047813 TaxID=3154608 RepID=UPI0033FD33E5
MTTRIHPPDSPPPGSDDEQLPCGRFLSQVWSDWENGATDEHQRACRHCGHAVGELEDLERAVRRLRTDPDEAGGPSGFDAAALTRRVMDVVRLELRPGRPLPLGDPDEDMWITESVAARTLRAAADRVPGVRAGSCRIIPRDPSGTSQVDVNLDIQAPLSGPELPELADRVRRQVQEAADQHLGLDVVRVDIRVTDLRDAPGPASMERGDNE